MLFKKLLPLYNATMERLIGASRFSKSEEAQFRLRVVDFSKKYSIKAAADASGVSRATIFINPSKLNYHNPDSGWAKRKVNYMIGNITALINPIMMLFIGGLIAGVLISLYLPVFTMAGYVQ